jgi:anti-sigma factor RsiW
LLTCRELIAFLAAYLDDELAPAQRADFEAHLTVCARCVDYLESYREAIRLGKQACEPDEGLPADVPSDLIEAILATRRS